MLKDWVKRNVWRSDFMHAVARALGRLDSWLWRKMYGKN